MRLARGFFEAIVIRSCPRPTAFAFSCPYIRFLYPSSLQLFFWMKVSIQDFQVTNDYLNVRDGILYSDITCLMIMMNNLIPFIDDRSKL